mgnify:CR=1 FL=1
MSNTLKFGNGQWAVKEGSTLAYNDENNNFKPLPFSFERGSGATVVNKDGLIETVGSDIPRIDYKDDSEGALLLEPSRTNNLTNSDNGSSYTFFSATKTLDEQISPDGTLKSFTLTGNGDFNQILGETPFVTLPSAGDYTFSVFAKKGTDNFIQLFLDGFAGSSNNEAYFDLENNSTPSSNGKIENYGNGWYRLSFVSTVDATDLYGRIGFRISYTDSDFFFPTANDTIGRNLYFYGFQLELGSYATSYIPTQGSAVTRLADVCNNGGNSTVFNDSEGVLMAEISALTDSTSGGVRRLSLSDGTNDNRIQILLSSVVGKIGVVVKSGGLFQIDTGFSGYNTTDSNKIAIRYGSGVFKVYINGLSVFNDAGVSFSSISLNNLRFSNPTGTETMYSKTKQLKYFNSALSDSELAALTQV